MNLVIDIGNSLQKMAIFNHKDELIFMDSTPSISKNSIQMLCSKYLVQNSIISYVTSFDSEIVDYLKTYTHHHQFNLKSKIPIQIEYLNPDSLGLDRIANGVAAASLFPNQNCLSIQLGTCIVYDFVNDQNVFLGGAISPGIQMRFNALNHYTANLPLENGEEIDYFLGQNTQQSIKSGVMNGAAFEIDGQIEAYKSQFSDLKVLLTGGDISYLQKSIKNQIFATPNLVLIGLNKILNLNV